MPTANDEQTIEPFVEQFYANVISVVVDVMALDRFLFCAEMCSP